MKRIKKLLSVLLVLVLALSLSACGPIAITKTAKNMSELDSLRADLDLVLDLNLTMMGEAIDFDATITGPFDIDLENGKAKGVLSVNTMGESLPILLYFEDTDESLNFYISPDGGETWTKNETAKTEDDPSRAGSSTLKSVVELTKFASSFEESGTETVKGKEAVLYTAVLPLSDLPVNTGSSAALAAAGSAAGADLDLSELDPGTLGSIPVTVGYDKENSMIVKASLDLTEPVRALVPVVMKLAMQSVLEQSGLSAEDMGELDLSELGLDLDIHTLTVSAELYDFDAVEEIVIPPEALAAEASAA